MNLKMLIDRSILRPGKDVLTIEYKGTTVHASLLACGQIMCNIKGSSYQFATLSGFSLSIKRLTNPTLRADNGWKAVKYNGRVCSLHIQTIHVGDPITSCTSALCFAVHRVYVDKTSLM